MVWVYGNSFESFLVAVVVPNELALRAWAKKAGVAAAEGPEGYEALCKSPAAASWMVTELESSGRTAKLMGFEARCVRVMRTPLFLFPLSLECLSVSGLRFGSGLRSGFTPRPPFISAVPWPSRDQIIKAVLLEPKPFDIERSLMTPTFKKKRNELLAYYQTDITAMYAEANKAGVGSAATNKYGCQGLPAPKK